VSVTFSITDELKRTFDLVALRREAASTLNGREWREYQKLTKSFGEQKQLEHRTYESEYRSRVEIIRRCLVNKAGEKNKDHVWKLSVHDRFNTSGLTRQAQIIVRNQHHAWMAELDSGETGAVDLILGEFTNAPLKPIVAQLTTMRGCIVRNKSAFTAKLYH
jgi:hypothetical protein